MTNKLIGRTDDLWKVRQLLQQSPKVLAITGVKGIGKTSLAKNYLRQNTLDYQHMAWVTVQNKQPITEAFTKNVALLDNLGLGLNDLTQDAYRKDKVFHLILNVIRHLEGRGLLVLDNVDERIEHLSVLQAIQIPNWHILATSDVPNLYGLEEYKLSALSETAALDLFYDFYKREKNDALVQQILEKIAFNTAQIKRIAKRATAQRWKLAQIRTYLQDDGLDFFNEHYRLLQTARSLVVQQRFLDFFELVLSEEHRVFRKIQTGFLKQKNQFKKLQKRIEEGQVSYEEKTYGWNEMGQTLLNLLEQVEQSNKKTKS